MQLRIENMPSKEFYTLFLLYLELYQIPESLFLTYLRGGWVLPDPPLLPPRLPVAYDFVNQIRYSYESVYFQAKVLLRLVFVRKPQQDPELIKVLTWIVQNVDHFGIRPEHLEKFHARTPPGVNFPNELQSLTDGFRFRGPRLGFIYEIVTKDCVGQATEGFQYLFVLIQTYRLTDAKTGADAMMVMFRYLNSIYDKLDTTGTKAELDRGALLR